MIPRALLATLLAATCFAAEPPRAARSVPPAGIVVPENVRRELESATATLARELDVVRRQLRTPALSSELANIEIFHKAVDWALRYNEFFDAKQFRLATEQLAHGSERVSALQRLIEKGSGAESKVAELPWNSATGLVVRGYRSRIDHSVQPYALVIPGQFKGSDKAPRPLWCWFHGRNEKLTELAFIDERMKKAGEFAPENAIVLHLYGRFCNANKFAGETDFFEALEDVRKHYSIDPNRIAVLGFSMGGAACWHIAAHHAGMFAGASPGAGFAETAVYAKVFAPGKEPPPKWEQLLWRTYDATSCAENFSNCPVLAYSGEIDPQKQSADIMEEAMRAEGLNLERLIGPKTGHKYEATTKKELIRRMEEWISKGRETMPPRVRFTTYTLRYNKMEWIEVDALEKHWERARIDAELIDEGTFRVTTKNVAAFTIALPVAPSPLDKTRPPRVIIDEQELVGPAVADHWTAHFRKDAGRWLVVAARDDRAVRKRHGLSGPIDDAFMDSFIFVRPTGQPLNATVGQWVESEMQRAIPQWRTVFRGEARVKNDREITAADIADAHLVLWGDPSSNTLLAKILPQLPLTWTRDTLRFGKLELSARHHLPVLIFPNPLNPKRYVVLNSSFTFREGSAQTNSQQTPKLPDWAMIDLRTAPNNKAPGLVVEAGFFNEEWRPE